MALRCFPACAVLLATVTSLCAASARAQDVAPSPAASPSPVVIPDIPSALSPLSPLSPQCTPASTCPLSGGMPGGSPPAAGGAFAAIAKSQFIYSKSDLALPAPMPIVISRTYRSRDQDSSNNFFGRAFGSGTTLNYNIFLYSNSESPAALTLMPKW